MELSSVLTCFAIGIPQEPVFGGGLLPKPKQRWSDVSSVLSDLAITTYAVEPARLQALLPDGFSPEVVNLAGEEKALVSAVTFLNRRFFVGYAPFVKLSCHQTNYRAYVRYKGKRAAWFFATSLGTPWCIVPRLFWKFPWYHSKNQHAVSWSNGVCQHYEWNAQGFNGREMLIAEGTSVPMGVLPGFQHEKECWEVLTHPFAGYLTRRDGQTAHYSVWHQPFEMKRGKVRSARFELFERLGLVEQGQEPHSVLLQQSIHYLVFLPPKRVPGSFVAS